MRARVAPSRMQMKRASGPAMGATMRLAIVGRAKLQPALVETVVVTKLAVVYQAGNE